MSIILNMAYPQPFLRVVFSGPLYTVERWSFGLTFGGDFNGSPPPEEVPPGIITAIGNFLNGVSTGAAKCDLIKVNQIGLDGRYTSEDTVLHEFVTPVGATGAVAHPAQVALAVSLETGARRGLAHRGRFYIPAPKYPVAADGLISITDAEAARAGAGAFLEAVEEALPGMNLAVMSKVGIGRRRDVTGITVGRVYDTIRSRRTSLPESYTSTRVHSGAV